MSSCFYRILTFFLFLHFPGSLIAVYAPSTLARRLLLNDSSYSSPPTTDASSFPNHKPISDDSASADFCDHDCNAHSLPHSRTLTISVVSIFIACVVMAFVSVFARRFCAPDANLHVDYYGIERNNETCKLNEALMRSLPMVNYGKADERELKMMMNAECAVCLCEFEEGELLRLLPACSHLFHKDCVDMWLFSHTTCPLCRLSLLRQKRDTEDVSQEHPAAASDQRRQDSTSVAAAEV